MTEAAPATAKRSRLSKGRVRAVAWVAGATTFLTGWGILGMAPKPAASAGAAPAKSRRPVIVVHKVLRRVIITDPVASAPVRYVGGSTSGSSSGATTVSAPPPPTTTTSGS